MKLRLIVYLWICSLLFDTICTHKMSICQETRNNIWKVGRGAFQDIDTVGRIAGLRSVIECASYCYADRGCNLAVYTAHKICLLVGDYEEDSINQSEDGIYLTRTSLNITKRANTCPQTCVGYSICVVDCTNSTEIPAVTSSSEEAVCVDMSNSQYSTDNCMYEPYIQSREFYLQNLNVDEQSLVTNIVQTHHIFTVGFEKKKADSYLRLRWAGDVELTALADDSGGNAKLGFWFDGESCEDPGPITSMILISNPNGDPNAMNRHCKPMSVYGVCEGLAAGTINITMIITRYESGVTIGIRTEASRLYVDEIALDTTTQDDKLTTSCPSLSLFNFQHYDHTGTGAAETPSAFWNTSYLKMEEDTLLRISLDISTISVYNGNTGEGPHCALLNIRVDGTDCQPDAWQFVTALMNGYDVIKSEKRNQNFEGYCSASRGDHIISVGAENCSLVDGNGNTYSMDNFGAKYGSNNFPSRMTVEEFRTATAIVGVMDESMTDIIRLPQFNMMAYSSSDGSLDGEANGENAAWVLPDYTKLYSSSGLRLTLSADGSNCRDGSGADCCRQYFKVNDEECQNPGTIEGTHLTETDSVQYYRSFMLDGVCDGIALGSVSVALHSGRCQGYSEDGGCSFGWQNSMQLLISETYIDREIITFD